MKLSVPEMSCGHCKSSITEAIGKLDSNAQLEFDMDKREVDVATEKPANDVIDALDAIGFDATTI